MSDLKKILFVINPISGTGKKRVVEQLLEKLIDPSLILYDIQYTKYAGHAIEIAKEVVLKGHYNTVVAVGGDGSVNEVSKGLIGSEVKLGIIPAGSGNGFARHHHIPLKFEAAIKTIIEGNSIRVDTGEIDEQKFVGVSGVGFDAFISKKFDEASSRGFLTYLKLTIREYLKYPEKEYVFKINGEEIKVKALIVSFCNSSQWGNDVFIAPNASSQDGRLKIAVVKKMPLLLVPFFALRLFRKTVEKSRFYTSYEIENSYIQQHGSLIHIDGEPIEYKSSFKVNVNPNSLSVIVK